MSCPHCSAPLRFTDDGGSLTCTGPRRHLWDVASSGYVNIAGAAGGDSKDAVRARRAFLALGHYERLAKGILKLLPKTPGICVDAGCGEGYYDSFISADGHELLGFDLSKPAIEAAAKRRLARSFFSVAGINAMPLLSGCADAVVNIFAPCFEAEFHRVLKDDGTLIIAAAGENHLYALKKALYAAPTLNSARADLPTEKYFEKLSEEHISYEFTLASSDELLSLFAMTPYYYRTDRGGIEKLKGLNGLTAEADFILYTYKKKGCF